MAATARSAPRRRGLRWPVLGLLGLSATLAGCGGDEPPAPPAPRGGYPTVAYPQPAPQQPYRQSYGAPMAPQPWGTPQPQPHWQTWGAPVQPQPGTQAPGWPQQGQRPATQPPADNPWQRPPSGFAVPGQAPQGMWQAQPSGPQFRPLEEKQDSGYRAGAAQRMAPYDRPMGSSQDPRQQGWGAGYYPGYSGYPGYPGTPPGYWGAAPGPWGWPGAAGGWPAW